MNNQELTKITNDLIDQLKYYDKTDIYRIVKNLYESYMDVAKQEGWVFIEIDKS